MAKKKATTAPVWFKMYLDAGASVREVSSKTVGDVVKALYLLAEDENYEPELKSTPARMLYHQLSRGVTEAREDYIRSVKNGKKGNEIRWKKASPPDRAPIAPRSNPDHNIEGEPEPNQEPKPYPEGEREQEQKQEPNMLLTTGAINPEYLSFLSSLPTPPEVADAQRRYRDVMAMYRREEEQSALYDGEL